MYSSKNLPFFYYSSSSIYKINTMDSNKKHKYRIMCISIQFSSVTQSCLTAMSWTAAYQASQFITNSWSLLKLMSMESVTPSNHLIVCHSLLLPPSIFPIFRVFSKESVLHIRWTKYWSFCFSISTSNEYSGLISLELNGLISWQSKGLSGVFSNTIVQKHQFLVVQLSLWSNFYIHT